MWTDNSDPERYVFQAETATEMALLKALKKGLGTCSSIERVFWSFDAPEYPGLNELRWRQASRHDPEKIVLVVDFVEAPEP